MMRKTDEKPRLPSLRALQVFAVAARHGSFTRAAQELHLTQGAVSRQVQELETALGRALFVRSGPQPARATPRITLSMLPSVAAKWMAPRLARFVQDHPHLDLRITASRHFVDFQAEEVDAAIRYGRGAWPGLSATHLCNETVFPVCSPSLAQRLNLQVVAEGVETAGQSAALQRLGCNLHQGYLYARPMPAEAFESLLAAPSAFPTAVPA